MKNIFIASALCAVSFSAIAQSSVIAPTKSDFNQWHMLDAADGSLGVSAIRSYNELLKGKKGTPVVVAIIDSGTETFHEDLREKIWVNRPSAHPISSTDFSEPRPGSISSAKTCAWRS